MNLNLRTFSQMIEDMGAALQGSATALIDISVGSVARALFEANASIGLWMQWLILQVLQTTRAATSTGPDLDSWMADFGLQRLPATQSTGSVTFSRFSSALPANIPVGTSVKTSDGSVSFSVVENTAASTWNAVVSAYELPAGVSSADVTVMCAVAGTVGNVMAGTIATIASSLPGVDQVTNASPFTDALDAESDQALRTRFHGYLAGLSRATLSSVTNAVANVQQGLSVRLQENTATDGSPRPGTFTVTIDDGSGYPPSSLLANVATAIEAVRPIGTMFSVVPPQVVSVTVACNVTLSVSASPAASTSDAVSLGIANYLNGLPIGRTASITRIAQCIYKAVPTVENVSGILLNGSTSDIVPAAMSVIKAGNVVVNVNAG